MRVPTSSFHGLGGMLLGLMLLAGTAGVRAQEDPTSLRHGLPAGELRELHDAARIGDDEAAYRLGAFYAAGTGATRDDATAFQLLRQAATADHAGAQYGLAQMYDGGRGVARDPAAALEWYRRAAAGGDARAQTRLGAIVARERPDAAGRAEALLWYRKAAQQGDVEAQQALLALTQQAPRAVSSQAAAAFVVARAFAPVLSDFDERDRRAHDRQTKLQAMFRAGDPKLKLAKAVSAYRKAEEKALAARDAAWRAMPFTGQLPIEISQPLMLAFLDLHLELRRTAGPTLHSLVLGLSDVPGCAGDIVADRLVYAYGRAAADGRTPPGEAARQLGEIARQIACLGPGQLVLFERGVARGFDAVASRLRSRGMAAAIPAFARALAPVQLLILDARKHRGERSLAWHWFAKQRQALTSAVGSAGWPAGNIVYMWNRLTANLLGFPACPPGQSVPTQPGPNCVDLARLIDSLGDPRAIGLGDCALAAMVMQGAASVAGDPRYVCPSTDCEDGEGANPEAGARTAAALGERRPTEPPVGADPLREADGQPLCRASGAMPWQGALPDAEQCLDDLFAGDSNPWDSYAGCMADAAGAGDEPPAIGAMPGVPLGPACRLAGDGGEPGAQPAPAPAPAPAPQPAPTPAPDPAKEEPPAEEVVFEEDEGSTIVVDVEEQPIDEDDPAQIQGLAKSFIEAGVVTTATQADSLAWKALGKHVEDSSKGQANDSLTFVTLKILAEVKRQLQKQQDCAGLEDCTGGCTGLGRQIAAANACTSDLLDSLREAMGLPRRGPTPGELVRPRDIVSIWHPDDAPVDESGIGICLAGGAPQPGSGAPNPCELMLCPGVGGTLAQTVGAQCSCGESRPAFTPVHEACYSMRCADGQPQGPNCECPVETGGAPGGPGIPIDLGRPE